MKDHNNLRYFKPMALPQPEPPPSAMSLWNQGLALGAGAVTAVVLGLVIVRLFLAVLG